MKAWTPLVMAATGCSGNIFVVTSACRLATALTNRLRFSASRVMLNMPSDS